MKEVFIMTRKKRFIVLDVEGMSTCRPYNIGYIVADRYGKIYKKRSIALPACFWENISDCLKTGQAIDMTKQNIQEILQDFNNKRRKRKYTLMQVEEFKKCLIKDIQRYKIKEIYAYNCPFDKGRIKALFKEQFEELEKTVKFLDIIPAILKTRLLTKKYIMFCRENGFLTEKGNIKTTAEIVYRYLVNDLNFQEEHTGLADVLIEYQILLAAFKTHKKLDFTNCQPWRELNKIMVEKGI